MTSRSRISRQIFIGMSLGVVIAVVIAIVGGRTATHPPILFHARIESKDAITTTTALFTVLVSVNALLLFRLQRLPRGERLPILTITAGSPFLTSRLAYTYTTTYKVSQMFSLLAGNLWVLAFMSVFEEFVVTLVYSFTSIKAPLRNERTFRLGPSEWKPKQWQYYNRLKKSV